LIKPIAKTTQNDSIEICFIFFRVVLHFLRNLEIYKISRNLKNQSTVPAQGLGQLAWPSSQIGLAGTSSAARMQSPRPRRRWQLAGGCNVAGQRHKHQGGEGIQSGKLRWRDSHRDGRSTMRGSVRVGMMVLGSGEGSAMVVSIQRGLLQYGRTKGSEEGSTLVDDDD
jgi:hypothetical protein